MPWSPSDAYAKTHFADTPELQSLWAAVENKTLDVTGDEGRAIREANAVVHREWVKDRSR